VVESKNNSLAPHIAAIKNLSILYIERGEKMDKIILNDSFNFKKGDIVTLNSTGIEFLEGRGFPAVVGALYSTIKSKGAEVLSIKGKYARVKLLTTKFPVTITKTNDFGVYINHLKKKED